MLSFEKSPLDPSSLRQIPNITNNDLHENKASSSSQNNHQDSQQERPDLLKSSLDDKNPVHEFSIRNYVFASRRNDISKNWPFSEKNLQLCMKHGISDPLPPFQTPYSVKVKCSPSEKVYNNLEQEIETHRTDNGEIPNIQNDERKLGLCKQNLAPSDCPDINSVSGSEEIDIDSVSKARRQPPSKKCKKSENNMVSQSMVLPKVCPVCKNFSSYSNSTLNAHIDQCLAGESTVKYTPPPPSVPPAVKYRVKPRKTRSMVDIYKSAPYCTLEELERRNGRSWATNSRFQIQETEFRPEEKYEKVSSVSAAVEDKGHEGEVYIDTDGRKVRILSKFSGVESSTKTGEDDIRSCHKTLKCNQKGKNLLSIKNKKKKLHGQKQQKLIQLGKNSLPSKHIRNSEAGCDGQENRKKVELHTNRYKEDHREKKKTQFPEVADGPRFVKRSGQPPYRERRNGFPSDGSRTDTGPVKQCKLSSFKKKSVVFKKRVVHFESDSDEDQLAGPPRESFFRSCKKRGAEEMSQKDEMGNCRNESVLPPQRSNEFSFRACDSDSTSDDEEFAREEENVEGDFEGSKKSLDSEFDKLDDPDHDDQDQDHHPMERIHLDDELEIQMVNHEIDDSSDSWRRKYFSNVDSISIPGPPGSFLPSLEDLGSEDYQTNNNSSLTTSRVQSSEEQQDLVYRDSSDSHSTIYNPSPSLPTVSDILRVPPLLEHSAPVVNFALLPDKRLKNEQPCCCSRKESASLAAFSYQDFPLVKRWNMAAAAAPSPAGKQGGRGSDVNRRQFYPISSPVSTPDFALKVSDVEFQLGSGGGSSTVSPATKYPVLRLMGKNLMVVNKDQDSPPLQQRQNLDARFSNNFISHVDPITRIPTRTGGSSNGGGGFAAALERHKYESGIQFAN